MMDDLQFFTLRDDDVNRIFQDYRAGRIDDAEFQVKVATWKNDWHTRIAGIVPGHRLEVFLDAATRKPVFRLYPEADGIGKAKPAKEVDLTPQVIVPMAFGRGR